MSDESPISIISQRMVDTSRAYMARLRPNHCQLMSCLEDGTGLEIRDISSGQHTATIPFPVLNDVFLVYAWLVSPDGCKSYLFSSDEAIDFALELDHERPDLSRKVSLGEGYSVPTGLCWFQPSLHFRTYRGTYLRLSGDRFENYRPVRDDEVPLLGVLDDYVVHKMSASYDGAYVIGLTGDSIGYAAINNSTVITAEQDGRAIDVAYHEQSLWVCGQHEVIQHRKGFRKVDLEVLDGMSFMSVDVLSWQDEHHLIVMEGAPSAPHSILRVARLSR